jgi:integrase
LKEASQDAEEDLVTNFTFAGERLFIKPHGAGKQWRWILHCPSLHLDVRLGKHTQSVAKARLSAAYLWATEIGDALTQIYAFTVPKTARSRRRVQLPSIVVEALRAHRRHLVAERLGLGLAWQTDYDLVFPNMVGGPMDLSHRARREFAKLLMKAEVPRIRCHDLRHTAATLLLAQDINPKVVSAMLGHSDSAITLSLYGHVTPPMQKQAAGTMVQIFERDA